MTRFVRLAYRLLSLLRWHRDHQRLPLFWGLTIVALVVPWMSIELGARAPVLRGSGDFLQNCLVSRISDGDTIRVSCAGETHRVRFYCIDAPEMDQGDWGRRSRDYLASLTADRVDLRVHDTDHYGRTIAEVFSDGRNLNRALVQAGWASEYPQYCRDPAYRRDERAAREAGRGVWSAPGPHQRPWEWRQR